MVKHHIEKWEYKKKNISKQMTGLHKKGHPSVKEILFQSKTLIQYMKHLQ